MKPGAWEDRGGFEWDGVEGGGGGGVWGQGGERSRENVMEWGGG